EREPPRPAWQPRDHFEPPVRRHAKLAVAGALDPELAALQARRVRPREAADDGLPRPAREYDAAAVDREVPVARPPGRDPVGGRRIERRGDVRPGRDRVQLQVVAREVGAAVGLDRLRPPDALGALAVE